MSRDATAGIDGAYREKFGIDKNNKYLKDAESMACERYPQGKRYEDRTFRHLLFQFSLDCVHRSSAPESSPTTTLVTNVCCGASFFYNHVL